MSCSINIKKLSVKIAGKKVLKNISLDVRHHDFITILGPNGAGKSSVLKAIMGFYKPASGKIEINHEPLNAKGFGRTRKKIGYMPQQFDVDKYFPVLVRDVISIGARPEGAGAKRIISDFKIGKLLNRPFGALSGGEKQKVMLAMVLAREPEILLLDEPNLNLDLFAYKNFLKLVQSIYRKKKLTVLFVTHLITHIPELSREVVIIKNGEIMFRGKKSSILKKKNHLELIYD